MEEISEFGLIVLIISAGFTLAVLSSKVTERIAIPAPAFFLLTAAVASDIFRAWRGGSR